jgi:hypothetical protein
MRLALRSGVCPDVVAQRRGRVAHPTLPPHQLRPPGAVNVLQPRLTIQSAPGHWAVIASPVNDPVNAGVTVTLRPGADGGTLRNLEITGGFYYGIFFFTSWENYGSIEERVTLGSAPSHWTISNVRCVMRGCCAMR